MLLIFHFFRTQRLLTYSYILKKRLKELSKKENILLPSTVILQKIISNEKLIIPRLKVFEEICPEIINWILMCYALEEKSNIV